MGRWRQCIWPLAATALALTVSAGAQTTKRYSTGLGAGSLPCSAWTSARHEDRALEHGAWVLGFLSGFGSAWIGRPERVDPLNGMSADGVLSWMDAYCEARPADTLTKAALALIRAHPN